MSLESLIPVKPKFDTAPEVVMRPIELFALLVNHKAPSGPAVIESAPSIDGSV